MKGTIENWSTFIDPRHAPEVAGIMAQGTFEGKTIRTSVIVEANGKTIKTSSRSVYRLGTPDPKFVAYLVDNGYPWDPENPIRRIPAGATRWEPPRKASETAGKK